MFKNKYVLITAARNEEALIENTIKCIIAQTIKPILWIIVSDDSTDRTDEIVQSYANIYNFITFIRNKRTDNRYRYIVYCCWAWWWDWNRSRSSCC